MTGEGARMLRQGRGVLVEFRDFIARGNLIDFAVAVVIGTAFTAVVTALVEDLITPLIAAIGGEPDFSALFFTLNGSRFAYGEFLNALLAFVLVAAVVFFLVVKPVNHLLERVRGPLTTAADRQKCPECLSEIPSAARRCAFCTAAIGPPRAAPP